MRDNIEGAEIRDSIFGKGNRYAHIVKTLTGTLTLTAVTPELLFLDPGGAARDVLLPPEVAGARLTIINTADAAEVLTLKDDSGVSTILTPTQAEAAQLFCNGTAWTGYVGVA